MIYCHTYHLWIGLGIFSFIYLSVEEPAAKGDLTFVCSGIPCSHLASVVCSKIALCLKLRQNIGCCKCLPVLCRGMVRNLGSVIPLLYN